MTCLYPLPSFLPPFYRGFGALRLFVLGLFLFPGTQSHEASLHGGLIDIMETCGSLQT